MSKSRQFVLRLSLCLFLMVPAATGAVSAAEPQQCGAQQISTQLNIDDTIPPGDTKYYLYDIDDSSLTVDYDTNVKIYVNILNYDKYNVSREIGFDSALYQYDFIYDGEGDDDTYLYSDGLAFSSTADSVTNINNEGRYLVTEEIVGYAGESERVEVAKPVIVIRPGSGELRIFGIPDDRVCLYISSGSDAAAGDVSLQRTTDPSTPTVTATQQATPTPAPVTPQATPTPAPVTPQPETPSPSQTVTPVEEEPGGEATQREGSPTSSDQMVEESQSPSAAGPGFGVTAAAVALLVCGLLTSRRL